MLLARGCAALYYNSDKSYELVRFSAVVNSFRAIKLRGGTLFKRG